MKRALVVEFLAKIAADPQAGDKVRNRNAKGIKTFKVLDRYMGGGVEVAYGLGNKGLWSKQITLAEWRTFCGKGATVLAVSVRRRPPEQNIACGGFAAAQQTTKGDSNG